MENMHTDVRVQRVIYGRLTVRSKENSKFQCYIK